MLVVAHAALARVQPSVAVPVAAVSVNASPRVRVERASLVAVFRVPQNLRGLLLVRRVHLAQQLLSLGLAVHVRKLPAREASVAVRPRRASLHTFHRLRPPQGRPRRGGVRRLLLQTKLFGVPLVVVLVGRVEQVTDALLRQTGVPHHLARPRDVLCCLHLLAELLVEAAQPTLHGSHASSVARRQTASICISVSITSRTSRSSSATSLSRILLSLSLVAQQVSRVLSEFRLSIVAHLLFSLIFSQLIDRRERRNFLRRLEVATLFEIQLQVFVGERTGAFGEILHAGFLAQAGGLRGDVPSRS